jgi:hypothetical protein
MSTDAEILITSEDLLSEEYVRGIEADLKEALGRERLFDHESKGSVFLEEGKDCESLPDTIPRTRSILRVLLSTPYYGPGYESGYWPEIVATLEFFYRRLPSARVWYGPGGTEAMQQVTREFLDEMWNYWVIHGGRPYYKK